MNAIRNTMEQSSNKLFASKTTAVLVAILETVR